MDKYKAGVHKEFSSLLRFPAIDFNKVWLIKCLRILAWLTWFFSRPSPGMTTKKILLRNDQVSVPVEYFTNTHVHGSRPCVIYYHGGGFTLPAFQNHKKIVCEYALGAGCDILFVNYSLSPENKSDTILAECFYAIEWLLENASQHQVDTQNIALAGDSAGGCLTASMCQMVADKMTHFKPCLQMLIYPVLDSSLESPSKKEHWQSPVWSGEATEQMWQAYNSNKAPYAVPMHKDDLASQPKTYIDNAEFDPLRDDASRYAEKLKAQGIEVEFHATKGTLHGYDSVMQSDITQEIIQKRIKALLNSFT